MLGGAFQNRRPRRRSAVGEPSPVRIGEPPGGQTRIAPELFGVDTALLEGGVDERLQDLARQQVDQHHLEVGTRGHCLTEGRHEAGDGGERVHQVEPAFVQNVADDPQLLEHVVEVRVVVDEALHLFGEGADPFQQHADRVLAFVDGAQQRLCVDQKLVDLLAAVAEDACDLVGVGQQLLDLVVALADGLGEPRHTVERGAQVRIGLVDGLRQHVQRPLHGLGVPARRRLGDIEERVVDLVGRGGLAERQHPVGLQRRRAAGLDLDVAAAEDGVGADGGAAFGPDLGAVERIADHDLVAVDLQAPHLADVHAGDAHLVTVVEAAGVRELRVVGGRGEQHRHAGEALPDADHDDQDDDAHHPVADAVRSLQSSHCGVHLPDGWLKSLTVRIGPPGCSPFIRIEMSQE